MNSSRRLRFFFTCTTAMVVICLFTVYYFDMDVNVAIKFMMYGGSKSEFQLQLSAPIQAKPKLEQPERVSLWKEHGNSIDSPEYNTVVRTARPMHAMQIIYKNSSNVGSSIRNMSIISKNKSRLETISMRDNKILVQSNEEPACKLPILLIDDPLIKPYLKEYGPLKCSEEKNWVYTGDGRFYIDPRAVRRHGNITCEYWRYDRIDDNQVKQVPLGTFGNNTPLNGDQFYAQCYAADGAKYGNIHAGVPFPMGELAKRLEKAKSGRPNSKGLNLNVFIYLIDSVSRINFIRKLPKFYSYLTERMGAYVMEGFNVVGDGTPWALIPLMTGHFQTELPEARKRFKNASYVDKWPFLFKNFTSAGYVTSYAEEQPNFGALQYKLKGFKEQPVDHYLRNMLLAVDKHKSDPYCLGDAPLSLQWLKFWRELQNMYRPLGGRQCSVMFSSETSHDDYNLVQTLDEHWMREFGRLYEEGYFNDTFLIIMADHGRRFGDVRQTQTGKIEEKLPFLAIIPPPTFRQKYPHSDANLRINRYRLVTVFDLHETLMNILDFKKDGGAGNVSQRGISLFKRVPAERMCRHAHIKAHFCSCLNWVELSNFDHPIVVNAAKKVIDYFNRITEEAPGRCAILELGNVTSARLLTPNDQVIAFKESMDYDNSVPDLTGKEQLNSVVYQIRFTTEPGGGDWEATVTYYSNLRTFGLSPDDVSRLNAYKDQSGCIINAYPHLRGFCYCV